LCVIEQNERSRDNCSYNKCIHQGLKIFGCIYKIDYEKYGRDAPEDADYCFDTLSFRQMTIAVPAKKSVQNEGDGAKDINNTDKYKPTRDLTAAYIFLLSSL